MMGKRTVVFIQARLGSSRLPAKVLLPLPTGRIVLEEVIIRASMIDGVDSVFVLVPGNEDGDIIERHVKDVSSVDCMTGPEDDVLGRFMIGASMVHADAYVRITADCPMLNHVVAGELIRRFWEEKAEYATNAWPVRTYPHGWDVEVFTRDLLRRAAREAHTPLDREHVTPWMQRYATKNASILSMTSTEDRSHERITLDTIEDYRTIWHRLAETGADAKCAGKRTVPLPVT